MSRSACVESGTSTTAGKPVFAGNGVFGFEMVADSEKPLAAIMTCSSLGRDDGSRRAFTAAMSSRTISNDCSSMISRTSWPVESIQTSSDAFRVVLTTDTE